MDATTFPEVVKLNVGGRFMATFLSTLTKEPESMLAAMFSGRHEISKDEDGRFFIDYDGNLFEYILNFLRLGTLPPKEKALEIYDAAVYFNVQSLINALESYRTVLYQKEIEKMRTSLDMKEYNRLKQDAMDQLTKCYARLEDDIIVLFIPRGHRCSAECSVHINVTIPHHIKCKHIIILKTSDERKYELKRCIAHDLNELGFGKYVYTDKSVLFYCPRCQAYGNHIHAALLVAYKIVELTLNAPENFRFV